MSPATLPRAGWAAVGVAGAATAAVLGLPALGVVVAGLALLASLAVPRVRSGRWAAAVASVAVGVILLGVRVVAGPPPAGVPPLPGDAGPWRATVEAVSSPRAGSQLARLRLETRRGPVVVAATLPAFPHVAAGDRVEVGGLLRPPPDGDPYGDYLRRTGSSGSLDGRRLRLLAPSPPTLQAARDWAGDALQRSLPEPEAGLAAGILIGLRERVDRALAADFATAGVSHVVAISGWNIAIVAGLVGAVLRGRSRRTVMVAILLTVVAYVVAAGASPSVVRAAVMAAVVLLARATGRAGRAVAALGSATTILLLADPALIGDAGFRLSVLATAGLLAWATPLGRWLAGAWGGRIPGWLAESLGISLAAQAATLPDVLLTFGRLSLVSPVVNLAVVPLVPVAMAGGVVALLAGMAAAAGVPGIVAIVLGLPGWLVLHVIVLIVRAGAAVPFAALTLPPEATAPAAAAALVVVCVVPLVLRRRRGTGSSPRGSRPRHQRTTSRDRSGAGNRVRRFVPAVTRLERLALVLTALVVGLSSVALVYAGQRSTRLVMLDIGQGDSILIESRTGERMLVDGGPDPERALLALDSVIPPWDRRIDVIVLTHPHEDHVAGLARVLERYRVGRAFEPGMDGPGAGWKAWNALLRGGPPRGTIATGARLRLGEITLTALWPDPGSVPVTPGATGRLIADTSIVLLGEANGRRFLLTGDAEDDVDPVLVARGLPRVDVLKVSHHGSAAATSAPFLAATRPLIAAISVGADNEYGHPAPSTLARLHAVGARVFRTDQDGTVSIELARDGVRVTGSRSSRSASVAGYDRSRDDPLAVRGGPPPADPRAATLVPAPRVRGRRRRGLARGEVPGGRRGRRRPARRGGRAPARRRQAPGRGGTDPPAPR